jgi:hypothetical protein
MTGNMIEGSPNPRFDVLCTERATLANIAEDFIQLDEREP